MPAIAPYGTWESPFDAKSIAEQGITKENVLVDRVTGTLYHVEARPYESGRSVVVESESGKDVIGKDWKVGTSVQEYGGAPAVVHNGILVFSNAENGQVYTVEITKQSNPKQITSNPAYRFGDFDVFPQNPHLVVCILEDHTRDTPTTIETSLVVVDTSVESPDLSTVATLVSGSDFYSSPRFNEDGTIIAWCQWNHPDMPWDGSQIYVARVEASNKSLSLIPNTTTHLRGIPGKLAAIQPTWFTKSSLVYTCDESDYQQPFIADIKYVQNAPLTISQRPLLKDHVAQDFADPPWWLATSNIAALDDRSILFSGSKDGRHVFYVVYLDGDIQEIDTPYVHITRLQSMSQRRIAFIGSQTTAPKELIICNFDTDYKPIYSSVGASPLNKNIPEISLPQPMTFSVYRSLNGVKESTKSPVHILFFPPKNSKFQGPEGEKPCAIVSVHGGPTSFENQGLNMSKQFFTSRGWAWIDVNYAGSSNYGRSYRDRLRGNWGIADVEDCVLVVRELSNGGLVDPARIVIRGGSAGGYTTLNSLSQSDPFFHVYKGGTSIYGISDVTRLYNATHKFQCRYIDGLMGGTPDEKPEIYRLRSPLFHASNIQVPLLILQGSIDPVVPREQAEAIVSVIEKQEGSVQYVEFEGESHGWRKAATIQRALEEELEFYRKILKL